MCNYTVFLVRDGDEQRIMETVDRIEPEGDGLVLTDIFGEQTSVQAHIHALELMDNKIYLKEGARP